MDTVFDAICAMGKQASFKKLVRSAGLPWHVVRFSLHSWISLGVISKSAGTYKMLI